MGHDKQVTIPYAFQKLERVLVSAKFGHGLIDLKEVIKGKCLNQVDIEPGRSLVPNLRQTDALKLAAASLREALAGLVEKNTTELVVSDLNSAKNALGLITGDSADRDILDEIFSKFCIGK